jgi:putative inorganic carbon (HCO3(-)) transporter
MSSMDNRKQGVLIRGGAANRRAETVADEIVLSPVPVQRTETKQTETKRAQPAPHSLAFAGLFLFTLLLYIRPQEMYPEFFGDFPLVKIVAIATLLAYFGSALTKGGRLSVWPIELKMVMVIAALGLAFMPIALSQKDTQDVLFDVYLKVLIIFAVMINVLNTRERLRSILKVVVFCGTGLAIYAVYSYLQGHIIVTGSRLVVRIAGLVEGMFGNPNDLATGLAILVPLSVALALTRRGMARVLFYACTCLLLAGIIVTFSRGGFLGLVAMGAVLLWKVGRRNRALTTLAFIVMVGVFMMMMPGGYASRLTTILNIEEDPTGSAQARRELLDRGVSLAIAHPVIGLGMGNFHIYSIQEQVAHNSYLEISAELGVAGLIAYLILIFAPIRSLRRIERETADDHSPRAGSGEGGQHNDYYMSVAFQAAFVAYLVCSFFSSIEYLWYIYYIVAYAVSLRQIRAAEQVAFAGQTEWTTAASEPAQTSRVRGAIWKPHQRAKAAPKS